MMNIIGHANTRMLLRKIALAPELSHHAFLFSGSEGIGKGLVGKEFASLLLGHGGRDPSSDQDFLNIGREKKKSGKHGGIPVEAIREAGLFLSRYPARARRRVVLIEDAEELSESAQNALLKFLEEPASASVIILAASRHGALRDTVLSRVFHLAFSPVPEAVLREGLLDFFDKTKVESLEPFFLSLGCPGLAIEALGNAEEFSKRRETLRSLFRLSALSLSDRLALSERLSLSVTETARLFDWWLIGLRSLRRQEKSVKTIIGLFGFFEVLDAGTRQLRDTNANPRLIIDKIFLSL